jgi:hypothetical protein
MIGFALFALFASSCVAHVCLLAPMQRGGVNSTALNTVGSTSCFWLNGPCGTTTFRHPNIQIRPASPYLVVFQKNQDHFYASAPGSFSIDLALERDPVESDFKVLATVADTATPNGYVYTQKVVLPIRRNITDATLRVRYITNNPMAPPVFYMCSSIAIY